MPVLPNRQHQKIFRGRAVLPNHLGSNYLIDIITSLTISEVVRGVTKETIFYIEKRKEKENSLAWVPSLPIVIVIITLTYYTSSSYLIMSIISCLRAAFYYFLPILFIIFAFSRWFAISLQMVIKVMIVTIFCFGWWRHNRSYIIRESDIDNVWWWRHS